MKIHKPHNKALELTACRGDERGRFSRLYYRHVRTVHCGRQLSSSVRWLMLNHYLFLKNMLCKAAIASLTLRSLARSPRRNSRTIRNSGRYGGTEVGGQACPVRLWTDTAPPTVSRIAPCHAAPRHAVGWLKRTRCGIRAENAIGRLKAVSHTDYSLTIELERGQLLEGGWES